MVAILQSFENFMVHHDFQQMLIGTFAEINKPSLTVSGPVTSASQIDKPLHKNLMTTVLLLDFNY